MTINNINNIINDESCYPPDCPEDFQIIFVDYGPPDCNYISWKIKNIYDISHSINSMKFSYSINNQNLNKTSSVDYDGKNYYTTLNIVETSGALYFKIKAEINNNFYESELKEFSLSECEQSNEYVMARAVNETSNDIIWVKKSSVPVPDDIVYFRY